MSLNYTVQGPDGQQDTLGTSEIVDQLKSGGVNVIGVSADGSSIRMQDGHEQFEVPVEAVLQHHGFKVSEVAPQDADYEHVKPSWRAVTESLGDDNLKRQYLQGEFAKAGMKDTQISGSGSDWYAFDPESGRHIALTNKPGMDMSDLAGGATAIPHMAGAVLGGLGGTLAAGPAGGIAGAGVGGAIGEGITKLATGLVSPGAAYVMKQNPGDTLANVGKTGAFDAVGYAVPMGASKALGGMFGQAGKAVAENGVGSTLARGAGWAAENTGRVVNKVAGIVDTKLGSELTASVAPFTSDITGTGLVAQLPGQAIRGATRGAGWLGERESVKSMFPEFAGRLRNLSSSLQKPIETPSNFTNEFGQKAAAWGNKLKYKPEPPPSTAGSTETILGNLGNKVRDRMVSGGSTAEKAQKVANAFRSGGRGIQNIENVGRLGEATGVAAVKAGAKAAKGGSYVLGKGGSALQAAGAIGQPIENRILSSMGSEELYDYLHPKRPWQKEPNQTNMNPVLASYDF